MKKLKVMTVFDKRSEVIKITIGLRVKSSIKSF